MKKYCKLIFFTILITTLMSCNSQNSKSKIEKKIDIDSIYHQIIKDSILVTGWYYISDSVNDFKRQLDKSNEVYYINPKPIAVKENFIKLEIYKTDYKGAYPDDFRLSMQLDKNGSDAWAIATERAKYKKLALIIDNILIYTPQVNIQVTNGTTILNRGVYTKEELEKFKLKIEK